MSPFYSLLTMSDFRKQRIRQLLLFYLVLLFTNVVTAQINDDHEEASFYGESYVLTPVEDANSSTSISLFFRTHRPRGLLLLAAGETDYIIIQLNAGIVETRVNLGSGEAVVFSARGVRLDDSRWHELVVNRTLDSVYVIIDGVSQGQGATPGPYHNLNVDLGVFLGGTGNLKKNVYRNAVSFRGCLKDVFYNGISVLGEAKDLKSAQNAFQVSWNCDEEFFGPSDSPISFSSDTSFIAFPHLRIYPSTDSIFSCQFKTRSSNSILLFNSGKGQAWEDFLAVELVEGRPKLSVDKGSGVIEVYLSHPVNDGHWHLIQVSVSQTVAQLQVDGLKNLTRFNLGGQNVLNLANYLYVGGVGFKARPLAIKLGLTSVQGEGTMKGSMLGCIKNIRMNARSFGFQHIQVSRLIHPECGWDYPCANDPCLPMADCVELEGPEFRCDCEQQVCVKDEFKSVSLERNKHIHGVLAVKKLEVTARSETPIDESNIRLNFNILDGIGGEDSVIFTLKERPKLGTIEIKRSGAGPNSFTLRDLKSNHIFYRHRGGASDYDSTVFQITFGSMNQNVESKLKDKYEFVLPIHIRKGTPSTKIKLVLSHGNVLSISSGARIRISKSILDVKDTTADAGKITFEIKFLRSSRSRFEHVAEAGKSIFSFTFKEVLDGSIWFVHDQDLVIYTTVIVTDGLSSSDVMDLRFKVEQLKISVVNNTGLLLDYGSSHLITSHNLSSVPSVAIEKIELLYHTTHSSSHGAIQRIDIDRNQWMDVESFTQDDIDTNLIRYTHLPGQTVASFDELWFEVLAKGVKIKPFSFNVRFKTVTLYVDHEFDVFLHQVLFTRLTTNTLSVKSNAESLDYNKIIFRVHSAPRKGFLYLTRAKTVDLIHLQQLKPLMVDDTFTQQEVNNGYMYYRVDPPATEESIDYIDLHASYFGFIIMARLRIVYQPNKLEIEIINEGLQDVTEGGYKMITENDLAVDMDDFSRYTFSVLHRPQYGAINVKDRVSSAVLRLNTSYFTMIEILDRQVVYLHDDSEHDSDSFTFSLIEQTSGGEKEKIEEIMGTFKIKISMRNDNAPVRTVNKVFLVATGQSRHLTIEDLAFKDPDIEFDSSQLFYQTQTIPNGNLLRATTRERVFNFTQKDLQDSNLLFQHSGESYGRAPLLVSDGKFFSNSLFEVQALDPYIAVVGKTDITVRKGQSVVISSQNLSVESNLDFDPSDIKFEITERPKFGSVQVHGREADTFYYQDLKDGHVMYLNNDKDSEEDYFRFIVCVDSLKNGSYVYVKISLDGMDEPPEVIHNQILEVTALQSETVTENLLRIAHKDYTDGEIYYIVTKLPERGYLTVKGKKAKLGSAPEFTQQDIGDGLMTYTSESSEISFDSFIFDVATEYKSLRNMEFLISLIPQRSSINMANISVSEGGTVTLQLNKLSLSKQLIYSRKSSIVVEKLPSHGQILLKEGVRQNPVKSFSLSVLSQGLISYRHDNSETLSDQFSLRASSPDDASLRQETLMAVKVTPLNDQPPKVMVNLGLNVWTGSLTLLTNHSLQASDPDSGGNQVRFEVLSGPSNGHLAYLNNTFRSISVFSQKDVDSQQVVFVHKGAENGECKLMATDGMNTDQVTVFRIHAKQVKIILAVNKPVKAFPNFLQPITNSTLVAEASAINYSHPIIYNLIRPLPAKGRLVTMRDGRPLEIKSFSQDDINQGKIFYQHRDQMRLWDDTDSIRMEITSTYATPLNRQVIPIQISFSNLNSENYRKLLGLKTPSVQEGKRITISRNYFDASQLIQRIKSFRPDVKVEFSFITSVSHGSIWFKDMDAEMGGVFTQRELNNGDLVYSHDNSDSTHDMFQFAAKIMVPRPISKVSSSSSNIFNFSLHIVPVNDQGFELLTRFSKIKVTQGLQVTITTQTLSTIDLDTGPEGIEYVILEQPENGMFVRTSSPTVGINSFNQSEIDAESIVYKHDGSKHSSTFMRFEVWDGIFRPIFSTMNIEVIPIEIEVSPDRNVSIVQGKSSVYLSNDQLKVKTNGDFMSLRYKVTQQPQCGKLFLGNSQVTEFSQKDIEQGRVLYVQDVDSPGDDFFVCDIDLNYIDISLDTVQFDVIMKPLIKQGPLLSAAGSHVAITRASLDASELALLTNDNPQFDIRVPPKFGEIMRKNRQRRSVNEKSNFSPVSSFTFKDISYTQIYFVANKNSKQTQDSFTYSLSAKGVPPAKGEFVIQLDPTDDVINVDTNGGEESDGDKGKKSTATSISTAVPKGEDKDDNEVIKNAATQSGGDEDNSSMILAVVFTSIILIILIIILVILFMRWRRRRQRSNGQDDNMVKPRPYISGPLQLEQPHVFIEPQYDDESPIREEDTALMRSKNKDDMYVNTSHVNKSHDIGDTNQWLQAQNSSVCKTSPVFCHSGADGTSDDYEQNCSTMTSGGRGSNASQDLMEWTLMDPDLLQHCYNSQPVLRNNQYWL